MLGSKTSNDPFVAPNIPLNDDEYFQLTLAQGAGVLDANGRAEVSIAEGDIAQCAQETAAVVAGYDSPFFGVVEATPLVVHDGAIGRVGLFGRLEQGGEDFDA